MKIISSQRYIDEDIVSSKIEAGDFDVMLSPEFEVDGEVFCVVLDGHHSLAAAAQSGNAPAYHTADAGDHDAVALIARGEIDDFLVATHMGDDYYDIETGMQVW